MITIKSILTTIIFASLFLSSCDSSNKTGDANQTLTGSEESLPEELKGLKVYSVLTETSWIQVAVLDDKVNSVTYQSGELNCTTIIIGSDTPKERVINAKSIISETDSVIVILK